MHPTDRGPTSYSWLLTAAPSLLREGEATTTQVFLHRTALTNAALAKLQRPSWRER